MAWHPYARAMPNYKLRSYHDTITQSFFQGENPHGCAVIFSGTIGTLLGTP